MDFVKYQHIEKLNSQEVDGLLDGEVYVFPKIDGTNGQIYYHNGEIVCASRNRVLSITNDNQGFCAHIQSLPQFKAFFLAWPDCRLFGEWLVPHSLKTYRNEAWNKFYVFDVMNPDGEYLPYSVYKPILANYDIEYIPPLVIGVDINEEFLISAAEKNHYLMQQGAVGEGIVIKRYDFVNAHGRTVWGKVVLNEFKDRFLKEQPTLRIETESKELEIAEQFITEDLVTKEAQKLMVDGFWDRRSIPLLIQNVTYEFFRDNINYIRKKVQILDFSKLDKFIVRIIKLRRPDLFVG